MKKQIQAEQGKAELEHWIDILEDRKGFLEKKVVELNSKIEAIKKRMKERRDMYEKQKAKELENMNKQTEHLQRFIKQMQEKSA